MPTRHSTSGCVEAAIRLGGHLEAPIVRALGFFRCDLVQFVLRVLLAQGEAAGRVGALQTISDNSSSPLQQYQREGRLGVTTSLSKPPHDRSAVGALRDLHRTHAIRHTTTPAQASGGRASPSCSSAPAAANALGSLMLFQVVSIQPSERWTCEMWRLKASAMPLTCRPMPRAAEIDGEGIAHLRDARAVEVEALVVRAGVLVVGADDVTPAAVPERAGDVVLQPVVGAVEVPGEAAAVVVWLCLYILS
jgi:hypothetical protein